jgi:glycosyltransferase involved in cell wall biosynthesis
MSPIRLAVICDYLEENWPSMDLVGEMILGQLEERYAGQVAPTRILPTFRPSASRLPVAGKRAFARNVDRLLNRFVHYPAHLRRLVRADRFDLFHLVDHSYAQLLHELPAGRAVVTCHDLDTFRCLLEPEREPRPRWFRAMARRTLSGLQKAAAVACDSEATRRAILAHALLPEDRLHVVYLAVDLACRPEANLEADAVAERLLGRPDPAAPPDLLHVGTNIARKRIDVLLEVTAAVRRAVPGTRLIKVGGALNPDQARLAENLGIAQAIVILPHFSPRDPRDRAALAAIYRRAALVLQPSDAEGFGLPVAEAIACGTPVLASDIPVLREVGGEPVSYAPVGNIPAWSEAVLTLLDERRNRPDLWQARRLAGLEWAGRYRWTTHVDQLVKIHKSVLAFGKTS